MTVYLREWLEVLLRWTHVISAIMWIGESFFFMWLDRALAPVRRDGENAGELWMAHAGGFYEVVKRKSLQALPRELFTFKWESYSTFLTGAALLILTYGLGHRAMLLEAEAPLSHAGGLALAVAALAAATALYHVLCATPLIRRPGAFALLGLALVVAAAYALGAAYAPRAVFLLVGAMVGTIMASNVFLVIIPAQRRMLAATAAGRPVDTAPGARAKQRSTHNHYLTLPALFTMLSNHFPALYAHPQAPAVLGLVCVVGVGIKVAMNERSRTPAWVAAGTLAALAAVVTLTMRLEGAGAAASLAGVPRVSFATARAIVEARCVTCHAERPTNPAFAAAPQGVHLDSPPEIRANAKRILHWAVQTRAMPLGNVTAITDEERRMLGGWVVQGADVAAAGPVQLAGIAPPAATAASALPADASPAERALDLFARRCALCHGAEGRGDGAASGGLTPRPRNYHDPAWQASVSDDYLASVITRGGAALGRSAAMPSNPDLPPEVVAELVRFIRKSGTP